MGYNLKLRYHGSACESDVWNRNIFCNMHTDLETCDMGCSIRLVIGLGAICIILLCFIFPSLAVVLQSQVSLVAWICAGWKWKVRSLTFTPKFDFYTPKSMFGCN